MTTYRLVFLSDAKKEWDKLGGNVREQFRKKLIERLDHPRVPSARLKDLPDCYKIKLRPAGYGLIYGGDDDRVTVVVIAGGQRNRNLVNSAATRRAVRSEDTG